MRNRAQLLEERLRFVVAQEQRLTAAEENVAHIRMLTDVFGLPVELGMKIIARRITDQPRARAIPAITGATIRDEKEHAIRIPMHQPGHRRMRILAARVGHFPRSDLRLFNARDDLPTN